MAPRIELFAFRYREPRMGKWTRARYRAERQEIAARYAEWEIIGPPDVSDGERTGVATRNLDRHASHNHLRPKIPRR